MKAGNQWHSIPGPRNPELEHRSPRTWKSLFLGWSGYFFCLLGIVLLSYCGYVLFEAQLYQAYQSWRFEDALKRNGSSGELPTPVVPAVPVMTLTAGESEGVKGIGRSVLLGRIEISRISFTAMVMEGIDNKTLRHAVGHIPGTALPGAPGNVGIAGHRDTFFRGLRNIRKADEITLTTLNGSYRYRVDSMLVVEPRETWVLKDTGGATLTLVTCYPFNFVGRAPQRFIVRARKIADVAEPVPSGK